MLSVLVNKLWVDDSVRLRLMAFAVLVAAIIGLLLYVVHDACIDMEDGLHRTVTPYEERLLAVRVVLCFVLLFLTVSFLA